MDLLTISNDKLKAVICPEVGASIHSLCYKLNGQWVDIMRPTPQEAVDQKEPGLFSSFHLLPYSNRIKNGVLSYNDKVYNLKVNNTDGHTIHGVARDLPWKLDYIKDEEMQLSLNTKDFENVNWPWHFSGKLIFIVKDNQFTMGISLKNESEETMPAGFGSHPYFSKKLTEQDDKLMVKLPLKGLYPGDTPIPTGKWVTIPEDLDFSTERIFDDNVFVDNCFYASQGSSIVKWLNSGVTMTMDADPIYENIIFYTPKGEPYFAIEPVTNCNNAFNMAEEGIDDTGAIYLQPGEEASGDIKIKLEG